MQQVEKHLREFHTVAQTWFREHNFVEEHYQFFAKFFQKDNLQKLSWSDIQKVGDHIHSLNTNALAKKRAFGNPNHEVAYYKNSFMNLAHGPGSVSERVEQFTSNPEFRIKGIKNSCWSEIIGNLFAEDYVLDNSRTLFALKHLGLPTDYTSIKSFSMRCDRLKEIIAPLRSQYLTIVGQHTKCPANLEIDQFFSWIYETYSSETTASDYWIIAPGEGAYLWNEWQKENFISIGWDDLGDLSDYDTKDALTKSFIETYKPKKHPKNDSLACYEFAHSLKIGDFVFVKKGISNIVGLGKVTGDYVFDETRKEHRHVRKVDWIKTGDWNLKNDNQQAHIKTLTKITRYPEYLTYLKDLLDGKKTAISSERSYWWLNANPKMWNPSDRAVGETQTYTSYGEKGNKRRVYKYFEEVKQGDWLVGYLTTPHQQIVSIFEITKGLHEEAGEEQIEFKKVFDLPSPIDAETLRNHPDMKDCEPLQNNQGSLFKLTQPEFEVIQELWGESVVEDEVERPSYSFEDLSKESFVPDGTLREMLDVLKRKKNIILQGPPGTGKTFLARRLAYTMANAKDDKSIEMVQFHQSYSYEDFIQGYRPISQGGFALKNGVFFRFCREAMKHPSKPHFFIIDEINRGNLSKIFGELMLLIEPDKRGPDFAMPLTYSEDNASRFYIPENVFLIGTMNTADRSLSVVDYALRRRFSFFDLEPEFQSQKFQNHLRSKGVAPDLAEEIVRKMIELNLLIATDKKHLGPGFKIGHSFFCDPTSQDHRRWYRQVIDNEIAALLKEYWFDNDDRVDEEVRKLGA
jgi:5-methylcytosine-specific restriction protein B